jgi:hypothetical protein
MTVSQSDGSSCLNRQWLPSNCKGQPAPVAAVYNPG